MTDFQFKAIMAMVSEILDNCKTLEDLEKIKKVILNLSDGISKSRVIKKEEKNEKLS